MIIMTRLLWSYQVGVFYMKRSREIVINGETRLAGIIAKPIKHSLSPFIHNTSFQLLNVNGVYVSLETEADNLREALSMIKVWEMYGVNISMPYKRAVIPYLDSLSEEAELTQAVNTVVLSDGKLIGHNTDGIGFVSFLEAESIDYHRKEVVILGAGGAAQAIVTQLALQKVCAIHVFKRNNETFATMVAQMKQLSQHLGVAISVYDFDDINALNYLLEKNVILVNTTNVGMGAQATSSPLAPQAKLRAEHTVIDIIYYPLVTPLMRQARNMGCQTFNGLGMLIHQAAVSFELWTGKAMPVNEIYKRLLITLSGEEENDN